MRFDFPWCWVLLPPLMLYLVWLARSSYAHLAAWARWGSLAARLLLIILLLGVLSRPQWRTTSNRGHVIAVLDISASVSDDNIDAAIGDIDQLARQAVAEQQRFSLIAFGAGAEVMVNSVTAWSEWPRAVLDRLRHRRSLLELREQKISASGNGQAAGQDASDLDARIQAVESFVRQVVGEHTHAEAALRLAANLGSSDERRTIYLLTDGRFTRGQWQKSCAEALRSTALVHAIKLDRPEPAEVMASALEIPEQLRIGEGFSARLRLVSNVDTSAQIGIYKDGFIQQERTVDIKAGETHLDVDGFYFDENGFHKVGAVVRPRLDTKVDNNSIESLTVVPGGVRVLYVDGDEDQIPYLKGALELENIEVEARTSAGVPQNIADLLSFDAFILCNVPADHLSLRQMQMVRTYVSEFGGGFAMLGGDESFGLGGFFNTPIEEVLPVRMPIQKDLLRPSLALMLVIDKSGSMEGVKIQLAKRAALATADAINPRDLIGVVGFDGEARILLELTAAADRATISSSIANLEAGGGTFLYPALQHAYTRLSESSARKKHVIVLSDGQTQGFGYEELSGSMAADGITVSTVGIGEGADMRLMDTIAQAGEGQAYFTNDFYSIPQIFTREALRASKSMLVERLVQPLAIQDDPALAEIDGDSLPVLTGYVATTPKASAMVSIVSETGDPILARWRYGLGRAAAFTSEPKPRWAEDWLEWPEFARFWSQLIRSITGRDLAEGLSLETARRLRGDDVWIQADGRDVQGGFVVGAKPEVSRLDEAGRSVAVDVIQTGPGLYEANVGAERFGKEQAFVWRWSPRPGEEVVSAYGYVTSFSPEFATMGVDVAVFEQMDSTADFGEVMAVGQSRLLLNPDKPAHTFSLAPSLLIAALLLIPLDILIRRLG